MAARKHNNILLHVVNLGEKKISIPVAQLGSDGVRTILITAGMDGDEYAGIEAAYGLIDFYSRQKISFRLIIIPIVNIPGFEKHVSINPLDNKYPKHIFPGIEKGSATQRLMYWLSSTFLKDVDLWIDLHSGAGSEILDPFIWTWESKNKKVNTLLSNIVKNIKAERIIVEKVPRSFVENIAKKKTAYILLESGNLGIRDKKSIRQHMDWVKQIVVNSNEQVAINNKRKVTSIYTNVLEIVAVSDGIWVPFFSGKIIRKGILIGEVRSFDGKVLQKVTAKNNGVFLYRKESMFCAKGEDLFAYANNKKQLV